MFKTISKILWDGLSFDLLGLGAVFIQNDLELHERTRKKSEKDAHEKESDSPGESQ